MVSLIICNVFGLLLVCELDLLFMMCVGVEIGVVLIKVFIIQLIVFLMLMLVLGKYNSMSVSDENVIVQVLYSLLVKLEEIFIII